jgi:hypothetical protein
MNSITFKDFLPLIGTLVTVIMGYRLVSVQINKNRRAKWIDDFRKEVANFFTIITSLNKEFSIDKSYLLLTSVSTLILYLYDSKQPPRRELIEKLRDIQSFVLENKDSIKLEDAEVFGNKLKDVMSLATQVILIEQRKI